MIYPRKLQRTKSSSMNQEKINRIAWPTSNGHVFTNRNDVLRCKAEGSYTNIYLRNGETLLISRKLKDVQSVLEGLPFFRTHESHLVNLEAADSLSRSENKTFLKVQSEQVPVSKPNRKALLELFHGL